jgi:hypothetical protein
MAINEKLRYLAYMAHRYLDNPAGRLWNELDGLLHTLPDRGHFLFAMDRRSEKRPNTVKDLFQNNTSGFKPRVEGSWDLVEDYILELRIQARTVRSEINILGNALPDSTIRHLMRWYPDVIQGLKMLSLPDTELGKLKTQIGSDDLEALEECSDLLHRHHPEPTLSDDKLISVGKMVRDLLNLLEKDKVLDVELRSLLLTHAQAMEAALSEADVRGAAGIQKALAETLGSLYLNWPLLARRDSSPDTWQKITVILGAIAAALSFGTAAFQALEAPSTSSPPTIENIIEIHPPGSIGSTLPTPQGNIQPKIPGADSDASRSPHPN